MPEGKIVKALSGFYYVQGEEGVFQCRARGTFKKKGISPLVGDRVEFELVGNQEGIVDVIYPRKNELVRPPIANIDQAILIFSMAEPDFSPLLLDKLLVHTEKIDCPSVIVLTKIDLVGSDELNHPLFNYYKSLGYPVIATCSKTGEGIEQLKTLLIDQLSVFSGQSGVGKSSLLNVLIPDSAIQTGDVSLKLGRGKHTTRHVELIPLPQGGMVADTPGFSQLDFEGIEAEDLSSLFIDFRRLAPDCKYRGCLHIKEQGCAVKAALERGELQETRYESYAYFMKEIQERKRRY